MRVQRSRIALRSMRATGQPYGDFFSAGLWAGCGGMRVDAKGEVGCGPPFVLFLSAFGFFFSLWLRCSRFAMRSSSQSVEMMQL
jgi:hypothetical protein